MRKNWFRVLIASVISISAISTVSSCIKDDPDGDWDPIKTDKEKLEFPAEGGELTIKTTNYSSWWIEYGYDSYHWDNGWEYENLVYPPEDGFNTLDAGWYSAKVGTGNHSNIMTVTVQPNTTGASRTAYIAMSVGDAFTAVTLTQE